MQKQIAVAVMSGLIGAALVAATAAPAHADSPKFTFIAKASSGHADVSYYGDGKSASLDDRRTTWTKRVGAGGYVYSLRVSDLSGEQNSVTCIIKNSKGKIVKKRTASGTYVSASCSYVKKF